MECKRIPSARVNCKNLNQIMLHPCLISVQEITTLYGVMIRDKEMPEKLSAATNVPAYIPEKAYQKYITQHCTQWTYGDLIGVTNWQAKRTFWYGRYQRFTTYWKVEKWFCLYHGATRIPSKYVASLRQRVTGVREDWEHAQITMPWILHWDNPEYYEVWKQRKVKYGRSVTLFTGRTAYWDDQDKLHEIPIKTELEYLALDKLATKINMWFKECMDRPAKILWLED